eukprot:gene12559-6379_t
MKRELYGGAAVVELEERFIDCSDLRPVPDTQEMFSDFDSKEGLIFDLLESVETKDEDSAKFHFEELCTMVKSTNNQIFKIEQLQEFPKFQSNYVTCLQGLQDDVYILLVIIRLKKVSTDLLICYTSQNEIKNLEPLLKIFHTLEIKDWSLFK